MPAAAPEERPDDDDDDDEDDPPSSLPAVFPTLASPPELDTALVGPASSAVASAVAACEAV